MTTGSTDFDLVWELFHKINQAMLRVFRSNGDTLEEVGRASLQIYIQENSYVKFFSGSVNVQLPS